MSTNVEDIREESMCPICSDYIVQPRIYDCGHTICERCMVKKDKEDLVKIVNIFSIEMYACPLCREHTLKPWYSRPVNRSLIDALSKDKKYKEAHDYYVDNDSTEYDQMVYNPPEDINLSELCEQSRMRLANNLYKDMLPILFEAAITGKAYINIPLPLAKSVRMVGDLISQRLFQNHNIYRMTCNYRDCTIELVKSNGNQMRNEYTNAIYAQPAPYAIENSAAGANV